MHEDVKEKDWHDRMEQFEWGVLWYDPMDMFNIDNDDDQLLLTQIESVLFDLNKLYFENADGKKLAAELVETYWRGQPMEERISSFFDTQLFTTKNIVMNENNFEYLKDQLKFMGFGDKLNTELEAKLKEQVPEFTLNLSTAYGRDSLDTSLHFRKSAETDMYFFNRYDAKMKNDVTSLSHSFYVNKGSSVTMKEAYNLLCGRAVNKNLTGRDDQKYNAWLQMDFKNKDENGHYVINKFHENYGFKLEEALSKHPVKEMQDPETKAKLLASLEKGNLQQVTFISEGKEQKMFVAAAPQFKSINVLGNDLKPVQKKSLNQTNKQAIGEEPAKRKKTVKTKI
jgi:hypothetical protein